MRYYVVNNTRFDKTDFAFADRNGKVNLGVALKCEECSSYLTSFEWLPPLEAKLSKGILGDVIFGTHNHFIISEKFRSIFLDNNFKGIMSFDQVTLYQNKKVISQKYYYPRIVLSNVKIDLIKSGVEFDGNGQCNLCQKAGRTITKMKGLCFDEKNEIDTDIFITKLLPGDIVFSERLKSASTEITNLTFFESDKFIPNWLRAITD
ncbi:hypothetical protein [Leptospira levettii]|uniref:hypothetical protein n=1 Tax=Leptospira levettii TaxID=2023178 RepID=UPI000C2AA025|nr:hypothetical protein [Leptospira levettii]PKA23062.1 hypothetical protein CH381_27705 [Leptospira sp. mixed culture ATI2-C-A1]TGM26468.1 hypothetical protein EHQ74_11195 [Leptospira levettii]TGM87979.1 hypothetical protein EHR00_00020 [Leptospira levettii]